MQVLLCCHIHLKWSYRNVHALIGYLTGNVFSAIRSDSKLSVLHYEFFPDMTQKELRLHCILLFCADSVCYGKQSGPEILRGPLFLSLRVIQELYGRTELTENKCGLP